jgi:hypothetical protein
VLAVKRRAQPRGRDMPTDSYIVVGAFVALIAAFGGICWFAVRRRS